MSVSQLHSACMAQVGTTLNTAVRRGGTLVLRVLFATIFEKATMPTQKETLKSSIAMSLKVIRMYDWMLDLFVLVSM